MAAESQANMAARRQQRRKEKKYVAPTANHHDVLFTSGTTKDAAEFKDTVQILTRDFSDYDEAKLQYHANVDTYVSVCVEK